MQTYTRDAGYQFKLEEPLWLPGQISIWTFHHVLDKDALTKQIMPIPEVEIDVDKLEQLIVAFLNDGGQFLSLDAIESMERDPNVSYAVMTLDDGYLNNFDVALPLFEKYQVPACIYITTGYPDGEITDVWNTLNRFIFANETISYVFEGEVHQETCRSLAKKRQLLCRVYTLIETHIAGDDKLDFFAAMQGNRTPITLSRGMSWQQLEVLAAHPLITLGAHTIMHPSLPKLSDEALARELVLPKRRLEQKLGIRVDHFAYPYGHYSEREATAVRAAGYQTATTIDSAFISDFDTLNPYQIPRQYINANLAIIRPGALVLSSISEQLNAEPVVE
ncbi:polysaccharide deacetylase family protein [Thaumasiovibrio subtropicus]|uniref:polysaccharide deacetylase family protein n=1 Tax=Thaumasiovibrio subtropicus TaxID=1891207 RepID=UPI00131D0BBB|nr:polysaccharide deacetylase family protein [Thaumasiovibrio subtropicus]